MCEVIDVRARHLLRLADFTPAEILHLLDLAAELKAAKRDDQEVQRLVGKEIALIFEEDLTSTGCSFEVAVYDQVAHVTFIGPSGSHLETWKLTAATTRARPYRGRSTRPSGSMSMAVKNSSWAEHDVVIEDSHLHDLTDYDPATDPHTDTIQIPNGASNIAIRHNTVNGGYVSQANFGSAAITSGRVQDGGTTNILIQDNVIAGGGYALRCSERGFGSNFKVINNRFSQIFVSTFSGFGPWNECQDETQVTSNVYHETGLPAPF